MGVPFSILFGEKGGSRIFYMIALGLGSPSRRGRGLSKHSAGASRLL